jgi:hypothetical protein
MANARSASRLLLLLLLAPGPSSSQDDDRKARFKHMSLRAEAEGLAAPFRGIVAGGEIPPLPRWTNGNGPPPWPC